MSRNQYQIKLEGVTPLVMHNNAMVDPLHPLKKKIAKLTAKGKKKTESDIELIYRYEFEAGLYFDPVLGPYIPTRCLRATLIAGARKSKDGKQFEQGLIVDNDARLEYEGPRDIEGLYSDGFAWTTVVGNQRASIMRTRPRFSDWSLEFSVTCEADLVDEDMIERALYHAQLIGLCDGRSIGMGRFDYQLSPIMAEKKTYKAPALA